MIQKNRERTNSDSGVATNPFAMEYNSGLVLQLSIAEHI